MRNGLSLSLKLALMVCVLAFASPRAERLEMVSAKGSVTVSGQSCNFAEPNPAEQCSFGGSGGKITFNFTGEVINPLSNAVPATGTFTIYYADTGLRTTFLAGTAVIIRSSHTLNAFGTCETRNAADEIVPIGTGNCSLFAWDRASTGATDHVSYSVNAPSGFMNGCCEPASGNVSVE